MVVEYRYRPIWGYTQQWSIKVNIVNYVNEMIMKIKTVNEVNADHCVSYIYLWVNEVDESVGAGEQNYMYAGTR